MKSQYRLIISQDMLYIFSLQSSMILLERVPTFGGRALTRKHENKKENSYEKNERCNCKLYGEIRRRDRGGIFDDERTLECRGASQPA